MTEDPFDLEVEDLSLLYRTFPSRSLPNVGGELESLRADYGRLKALHLETLLFLKSVTNVGDELEELRADYDRLRAEKSSKLGIDAVDRIFEFRRTCSNISCLTSRTSQLIEMCSQKLISSISEEVEPLCVGGRRVEDAIVVSAVIFLSFVYLYLIGFIDRGGSKAGSSGSLDFRDVYISIVLFQAAYVWIKFRDVIPRGAVYKRPNSKRPNSNKWEPRIKFPVKKGVGGTSKRIPLGSYDTRVEGEVVYQIAAVYCDKRMHRLGHRSGRLNLGGGAYYFIRALDVNLSLPYEEQVNLVGDQVLKVYAEFEDWKASGNLLPHVPGLASEMPTGEGEPSTMTSPIQQPQEPLNSGMDLAMQAQGPQPAPNIHNGVDFNNPSSGRHELLEAYKEIDNLKAQVFRKDDQINEAYKEIDNWKAQVSRKDDQISEAYKEIDNLKAQVSRKDDQINEAYKEIDNWKAQVSRKEDEYNLRLPDLDFDPETIFDMFDRGMKSRCEVTRCGSFGGGLDLAMQAQGPQPAPNIHNGVDFNNPSPAVLAKTQHELLEALKKIDSLEAQLSRKEDECNELKQRPSELEGLLERSRLPELDFDPDTFFDMNGG